MVAILVQHNCHFIDKINKYYEMDLHCEAGTGKIGIEPIRPTASVQFTVARQNVYQWLCRLYNVNRLGACGHIWFSSNIENNGCEAHIDSNLFNFSSIDKAQMHCSNTYSILILNSAHILTVHLLNAQLIYILSHTLWITGSYIFIFIT